MNKKRNTALTIAVISIIASILGGVIYFSSNNKNQTLNIFEQKKSVDGKQLSKLSQQNETTNETSAPSASSSHKLQEISFDRCGKIDKYKNESWYSAFTKNLNNSIIAMHDISEACLSLDKTILIAVSGGSYCEAGLLFQYDVSKNVLSKAIFDDHERGCVAWPAEFGKRNGKIISLQGSGGDAGCGTTMYYEYTYVDNKIELKRECGTCEGEKKETCFNYEKK